MNPYEVNLADVAIELNADLKILWNRRSFTLKNDVLKKLNDSGVPLTILTCAVFVMSQRGMTEQEIMDWCKEAWKHGSPSVEFNAPEGAALNVQSKEKNPLLNKLIEEMQLN